MSDYNINDVNNLTNIGIAILDEIQLDLSKLEDDVKSKVEVIDKIKDAIKRGE